MYRNTANMKQLTIMKCSFEAGFWKIRSLTGTQHTVYDNDGKEKWKYWEVSARLIGDPQKLIGRYIVLDKNGSGFTYRTVELSESSPMNTGEMAERSCQCLYIYAGKQRGNDPAVAVCSCRERDFLRDLSGVQR